MNEPVCPVVEALHNCFERVDLAVATSPKGSNHFVTKVPPEFNHCPRRVVEVTKSRNFCMPPTECEIASTARGERCVHTSRCGTAIARKHCGTMCFVRWSAGRRYTILSHRRRPAHLPSPELSKTHAFIPGCLRGTVGNHSHFGHSPHRY